MSISVIAASAAFVGLVHSLAPGHWLPVVLTARARRWPVKTALLGAVVAASGHIFVSVFLGLVSIQLGAEFLTGQEEVIEHWAGLGLVVFGFGYAALSYFKHHRCHGHGHHGPVPKKKTGAFIFLFSLGFSPCVAVLPVFVASAAGGPISIALAMASFSIGVLAALVGGTWLVTRGVMKLDHPLLEHYGDVITGLGVALLGAILFLIP